MGWSDILGAVGSVAGSVGSAIGGDWGKLVNGLGSLANLGGSIGSTIDSSGQSQHAADVTSRSADAALALALQQANMEKGAYDKAMDLIPKETDAYNALMKSMGPSPDVPQFDESNVENRAQQLLPEYMSEADDQMTDMFGRDMGTLMRAGIDNSTYGIQARAALGAKSADVHRTVYNKAYQDALDYATGIYDDTLKGYQNDMSSRAAKIKEVTDPYTTAIGGYTGIYNHTGGASQSLSDAGQLADLLSKSAATGSNALATGAAGSGAKSGLSDLWAGLTDIFGNSNSANNTPSTIDPTVTGSGLGAGTGRGIGN